MGDTKVSGTMLTSHFAIFYFFTTLHGNLIKTQTSAMNITARSEQSPSYPLLRKQFRACGFYSICYNDSV